MSLSGNLKTMDLAELLQWVTLGRKTGSLTFVRNKTKNYIFFKDGRIISSKSNEPIKQLGHYLLFEGKITELQLKRALEIQQQTRSNLGKILVQEGIITKQEAEKALVGRTEEVIYDLFLWEEGYFHFTANGFNLDEIIPISLDINAIIFEGVRRKDEWSRIRAIFPSNNIVLAIRNGADLKSLELKPLQKKLLFMVSQGKTISEMILELHGSDFQVNFALFQLFDLDVLQVKEIREAPQVRDDPGMLFNRGQEFMKAGRFQEAIAVFQEVLRLDPHNAKADEGIDAAEKSLCQEYYKATTPPDKTPYFIVPDYALTRFSLSHQEGFVASRITGFCDIRSIVMLSPLRELEILQILDKLIKLDLIAIK
jgi:tetratricopeptide (TPR) repeat protein